MDKKNSRYLFNKSQPVDLIKIKIFLNCTPERSIIQKYANIK